MYIQTILSRWGRQVFNKGYSYNALIHTHCMMDTHRQCMQGIGYLYRQPLPYFPARYVRIAGSRIAISDIWGSS